MNRQKVIMSLCLLGAAMSIASCNSQKDSTSGESNSATTIKESIDETTNSSTKSDESTSEIITSYKVSFDYNGAYDNEVITYNKGDVIDLSTLTFINDSYDCYGWSDGVNEYDVDDKIVVENDMNLVGNYVKKIFLYELSEDKSYYIVSQYIDEKEEAIIPSTYRNLPVKEIKGDVFQATSYVTKLTIADSIETIAAGALDGLTKLESLTTPFFGNTIDDLDSTFGYLYGVSGSRQGEFVPSTLQEVTITKQETIGKNAFANLSNIKKVSLLNAKTIKIYAFSYMNALQTVELNEGLEVLEKDSFFVLSNLFALNLPSTLKVYDSALYETQILSLHLPKSLEEYTNNNENIYLESITVDQDNEFFTSIDGVLYNKDCSTLITYPANKQGDTFKLLDSVKTVGYCAFKHTELSTIDLNKVEVIEDQGFNYSHLTSLTLPSTIRKIGLSGFGNGKFEKITFPEALTNSKTLSLGRFVFSSNNKLTEIVVPAYVENIPEYFVASCEEITSIKLLGSVSFLGQRAFAGTKVKELDITFKDSATIGDYIFITCEKIETLNVHFESGVVNYPTFTNVGFGKECTPMIICDNEEIATILKEKWGEYKSFINTTKESPYVIENNTLVRFNGTETDVDITIPNGVTRIAKGAFSNNNYLHSVTFPESIVAIETDILKGCDNLRYVRFLATNPGSTIKCYNNNNVETKLESYNWPTYDLLFIVNTASDKANLQNYFSREARINSVFAENEIVISSAMAISADGETLIRGYEITDGTFDLPDTIKYIDQSCFFENTDLTEFDFTNIITIGNNAFDGTSLENVVLPESVTSVGESGFANIQTLLSIKIEGAVTLGETAFAGNEYLQSIDLGSSIVSIGIGCFTYAAASADDSLALLVIPSSVQEIGEAAFEDANIDVIECHFAEDTFDAEMVFTNFGGEVNYTE